MGAYEKVTDLAYGENPHQRAAYYQQVGARMHVLSMVRQLGGKELSFNNVLDLNAARLLVARVRGAGLRDHQAQQPVRRARPPARRSRPTSAPSRATRCRPSAASSTVNRAGRQARSPRRSSSSSARSSSRPHFTEEALEVLAAKPNMRILEDNERRHVNVAERDLKRVMGGLLVQDRDIDLEDRSAMEVVTERKPTEREWGEMLFAWKVCKHVRSNAIVLSKDLATVGIGAGQMSRVDSVRLAIEKARDGRHRPRRLGARLGRVLPVLRRPAARDRRGRDLHHPAGRLEARPRGRRGRGRRRHLDGLHPPPALQALDGRRVRR